MSYPLPTSEQATNARVIVYRITIDEAQELVQNPDKVGKFDINSICIK